MENLKIRVTNKAESKEAQELFFSLGCFIDYPEKCLDDAVILFLESCGLLTYSSTETFVTDGVEYKEITIPELRDMVVLKRNDPKDATHTDQDNWRWFVSSNGTCYVFACGNSQNLPQWDESSLDMVDLKPIKEEVMKEFLNPEQGYSLVKCFVGETPVPESWIEVPEGAIKAYLNNSKTINFVNKDDDYINSAVGKWCDTHRGMHEKSGHVLVWQRGEESLNDKIEVAEVARQELKGIDATLAERQSQYGSFEDVAFVTENIMATLAKVRSNGLQDLPNTHRMALYMIASKMARIVNGDFNHLDSWHDIGGYSKLIEDLIGDNGEI